MKLSEFVEKYKGKPVDFDGQYGAQCVDLARQYFKEVWNIPRQPEGVIGAQDFFFKHDSRPIQREYLSCIAFQNLETQPPVGSVVIFKSSGANQYGHIAICLESDENWLTVFEQDGIANAKALEEGKPQKGAYISKWGYERLIGWLIKKEAA